MLTFGENNPLPSSKPIFKMYFFRFKLDYAHVKSKSVYTYRVQDISSFKKKYK